MRRQISWPIVALNYFTSHWLKRQHWLSGCNCLRLWPYCPPLLHADPGPGCILSYDFYRKCYYSHLSGDQIDKVLAVSARDKNRWPRLSLITRRDEGTWERGRKFIPWVNRVFGWNHVYDTKKKKLRYRSLKKKKILQFSCSSISSLSFLLFLLFFLSFTDLLKENIN